MEAVWKLPPGARCATDQVVYNLARRGIEHDLIPRCRKRRVPIMAYSPLDQVRLRKKGALDAVAKRHGVSVWQVALAWVLSRDDVIAIPKAADPAHVRENFAALSLKLAKQDHAELDAAFPPPKGAVPLEMI
jgi:diketogulonate reductase-like aldo/keto reductase